MANLKTIKEQIYKFLASEKTEVMAITGDWGVGKTYAWEKYLKKAKNKNKIGLNNYSYVSLFGINSIKELRFAIFQNSINKKIIGKKPNLDTFQDNALYLIEALGKKVIPLAKEGASIFGLDGVASQAISYLSVSKTIICLDDFERTNLNVLDILGIISELKEKKNCKVILILNDSKLNVRKQFETHSEKVIEKKLKFKPTPEESADIRFNGNNDIVDIVDRENLKNNCIKLKITNIRIMNRIIRLWQDLQICIVDTPEEVKEKIASSLVLSCGSFYKDNEEIPDIEFIKNYIPFHFLSSSKGKSEDEKEKHRKYEATLRNYRDYTEIAITASSYLDVLDEQILAFVENGYFNKREMKDVIDEHVKKWNTMVESKEKMAGYETVWRNIFNRFDNDEQEIINSLYNGAKNCVGILSIGGLNGTLKFLRRFGADDKADKLIDYYIKKTKNKDFFNLEDWRGVEKIDNRMEEKFTEKYNEGKMNKSLDEMLEFLEDKNGFNDDDGLEILNEVSSDDYYNAFKNYKGQRLKSTINNCFHFGNEVAKQNINIALEKIGKENRLNKVTVDSISYSL